MAEYADLKRAGCRLTASGGKSPRLPRRLPSHLLFAPFVAMIGDIIVNELNAIMEELGGEGAVGRPVHTGEDMSAAIREGFPHSVVQALVGVSGLTLQEVASSLDLSIRSLQRRKHEGRLATYESDRIYRLARVLALAEFFIGDHGKAIAWLRRPNRVPPLQLLDTELGARQIENVLGRIGYGGIS